MFLFLYILYYCRVIICNTIIFTEFNTLRIKFIFKYCPIPKNSLVKQYKKMFEMDGISLEITSDAVKKVAKRAIELKTGARGLRNIMEDIMLPIMYEAPGNKNIEKISLVLEEDSVVPKYVFKKDSVVA